MSNTRKTAIVTGASQGIGAGIVRAFVARDYNVVANSRKMTQSTDVVASDRVALVDGNIGDPAIAAKIVKTALPRFQSINVLVNNAGIFFTNLPLGSEASKGAVGWLQGGITKAVTT